MTDLASGRAAAAAAAFSRLAAQFPDSADYAKAAEVAQRMAGPTHH